LNCASTEAAAAEGGHVEDEALRALERDLHPRVRRQLAALPDGRRAPGQRVAQGGQHVHLYVRPARHGDVDGEGPSSEGIPKVDRRSRAGGGPAFRVREEGHLRDGAGGEVGALHG
jgi:hypothetical protein